MTRGEDRTTTFLLTALTSGLLTESLTRFVSLMRFTVSQGVCGGLGLVALLLLFMHMGLSGDYE